MFIIKRYRFGAEESETFSFTLLSLAARGFFSSITSDTRRLEIYEELSLSESRLIVTMSRSKDTDSFLFKVIHNIF